jgi:hypothetical protein
MLMPVETADQKWGVLALCAPIENQLTSDRTNLGMWGALLGAALDRKSLLTKLADQQVTLRYAYEQRLIAENIRDLIGMLDQQGRYLYASASYGRGPPRTRLSRPHCAPVMPMGPGVGSRSPAP